MMVQHSCTVNYEATAFGRRSTLVVHQCCSEVYNNFVIEFISIQLSYEATAVGSRPILVGPSMPLKGVP